MSRGLAALAAALVCSVALTAAGPQPPQGPTPQGPPPGGPPGGGPRFTPPTPKNLQVLPKDMDGRQVMGVMRGFTQALGVRCVYCHVPGPNEQDLNGFDFASDEKGHKKDAREMLKFTMSLNQNFPKDVGHSDPKPGESRVTCWTCHRGDKEPQTRRPEGQGGPGGPGGPGAPGAPGAPPQGAPARPPVP